MAPKGSSRARTTSAEAATPGPSRRQPHRTAKHQPEPVPAVQEDDEPVDTAPTTTKAKKPSTTRSTAAGRSSKAPNNSPPRTPGVESNDDDDEDLYSQGSSPAPVRPRNTGKVIATIQPTGHPNISYGSAPFNIPPPLSTPSHDTSSLRGAKSFFREASIVRVKSKPEVGKGEPSKRGEPESSQIEQTEIPDDPNGSESDYIRTQLAEARALAERTVANFGIRQEDSIDRLIRRWHEFVPYLEETVRWLLAIGIVLGFIFAILFALNSLSPNLLRPIKSLVASSPLASVTHPNCSIRIDAVEQHVQANWHAYQRQKDQTKTLLDDLRKDIQACLTKSKASATSIAKLTDRLRRLEDSLSHPHSHAAESSPNFFSAHLGAKIDPRYTSPTLPRGANFVRQILSRTPVLSAALHYPPTEALRPWQEAGQCWCAANDALGTAQIAITMPAAVVPWEFGVEHLTPSFGLDLGAKPVVLELWVKMDMPDSSGTDGDGGYLQDGCLASPPAPGFRCVLKEVFLREAQMQSWFVKRDEGIERYGVRKAVVRVTANNGADFTCFYRVKLGGKLRDGEELEVKEEVELS